jgi:hypothetical protein
MNLRTTLVLVVLAAAGVALALYGTTLPAWLGLTTPAPAAPGKSLVILAEALKADKLTRIEVAKGGKTLVLERTPGGEWGLPGKWPTRQAEVEQLVSVLSGLHTRFQTLPLADGAEALKRFGLDRPAVTVTVLSGNTEHRLAFAEGEEKGEEDDGNRFSRPTYLRIDELPEVVRLGPGVVAALDKPADYYQQRRLFASERVPREPGSGEKVEQLAAQGLAVEGKKDGQPVAYTLTRSGEEWELSQPVRDRVDPDKLRPILSAAPDIWAEQFVDKGGKPLSEFGLEPPEETVTVTRPSGDKVTLLVGKKSPTVRERKVTRPSPPGVPVPPATETVKEEFRYAMLKDNAQLFEIKADKLKDLVVAAKELRDARLARFRTADARRLELKYGGQDIVLVKDKERWQIDKPLKADAETSKVNEVLDKLAFLEARDADVIDKADPKAHGFDDPARVGTIKVTVEEEKGEGENKTKKIRIISLSVGKHDVDKKKLYVRVDGWERVNAVEDSLVSLAKRPALAYRGRRVLDFATSDLDTITVERPGETVALKREKEGWRLTSPVAAEADSLKVSTLTGDLGTLEATEYVNDNPQPKDLEDYGLAKGALKVSLTFSASSQKPAKSLLVGKARADKPEEFYAKIEDAPAVFAVKKTLQENLDQPSLAYRPLTLWQVLSDDVTSLRIQQAGQPEYRLARQGGAWKVSGPFDATALTALVEPMLTELAGPRGERYEVNAATDLKPYGLDAPHVRVTVEAAGKQHTLLVGGPTGKDPRQRFAKLGDSPAVLVVGDKLAAAIDRGALDLLDRQLLTLDPKTIQRLQSQGGPTPLTLERKGEQWQVTESPAPAPYPADAKAAEALVQAWSNLQALRYVAYGDKADLAKYGLDRPAVTWTVTVQLPEQDGKKPAVKTHTLALGKVGEGSTGERYARLDNGPGIAVLPTFSASELTKGYLDFVDHGLLKFESSRLSGLVRRMGPDTMEVTKRDDLWQVVKPVDQRADDQTLANLADRLASLRVERIVEYPVKDLKPYGLDTPAAVLTLRLSDGAKPAEKVVKIGKPVNDRTPAAQPLDRYVQVEGVPVVAVLSGSLADALLAPPLRFRDRNIARFADADRLLLERGPRKATFAKVDGTWKLTEPLQADAEQTELEDFINETARLRADELVAEKPADLKPYGLDRPEARWRFQQGTKDVLNLLIGGRDKSGTRSYARLEGGDIVFVLGADLTKRVLAEYRKRTVWSPSLDAAQVETVRYGHARNPFLLEKIDTTWRVVGKPEVKVSTEAVSDALAALAGLRVERYVVDKGADLKLYGLEPPELVLEVQTRDGRKVLHVGRREGETKNYYARVPEKDRSDVFVIGEKEAERIVRDLAKFGQKPSP